MTDTLYNMYNRQQQLKTWKPFPSIQLQPEEIQYYNHRIETMEKMGCYLKYSSDLLEEELEQPQIDVKYIKYIGLKYMINLIEYIENNGVKLENIEWNIRQIINEILTNQVSEDYYLNTIDIYESINQSIIEPDIYYLIDQAIRLDNKRMLYYLIFREDEDIADRVSEVISE